MSKSKQTPTLRDAMHGLPAIQLAQRIDLLEALRKCETPAQHVECLAAARARSHKLMVKMGLYPAPTSAPEPEPQAAAPDA